jgi:uncharacterized protein (DUF2267 family)
MAHDERHTTHEGRRPRTQEELDQRRMQRHDSRTSQTYKAFLKNLQSIGSMNAEFAEQAAISVLCALEQRLTRDEAAHMEAQLPVKLTKLLSRCDRHLGTPPVKLGRQEFVQMVAGDLGMQTSEVEPVIRAVFAAVREQISEGEVEDVLGQLPAELRDLWRRPS